MALLDQTPAHRRLRRHDASSIGATFSSFDFAGPFNITVPVLRDDPDIAGLGW